jgi:hypothetical protein
VTISDLAAPAVYARLGGPPVAALPTTELGSPTWARSRADETSGALATNHGRGPGPRTAYQRNAALVAAAVAVKYSRGQMKPHSRNFTPSVTARR